MHDLLYDPLIGVHTTQGARHMNLPELLAGLSAGEIEGYTGMRAHQADPWHVFLVQLAASIQARRPTKELPTDPDYWRKGLLDLADGKASAWELVVDDVTKPAFFQHPWRSWKEDAAAYGKTIFEAKATRPDELDVLVTSKNHDVKMARMRPESIEAWIFAIVLVQTTSGYSGQGNYGIVRMNGGYGSRPVVAWADSLHPSQRFINDTQALINLRSGVCSGVCKNFRYAQRGVVLTWLTPWDRTDHQFWLTKSEPQLEPWFIEAARSIRLRASADGSLFALGATSKARQIGPKTVDNGDVGDPWIPINVSDKKKGRSALTLSGDGFSPTLLTALFFEREFELTPLQKPEPGDAPGWFVASCLARGQGETNGFHHVAVPVPPKARMALFNNARRDTLAHLAQQLLGDTKDVQMALGVALSVLTEGAPDRIAAWVKTVHAGSDKRWKEDYFPTLWRGAEEAHDTVRRDWQQQLVDMGQALLDEAAERLPIPSNRRWRGLTQAQRTWHAILRKKGLPMPGRIVREPVKKEETSK
jgi:CRISPR system Cascade subunit CasA